DVVTEKTNAGIDTVQSRVSYTLGANIENLMLIGESTINGTGNSLDNTLIGSRAGNVLNGGAGADAMMGNGGDDIYTVDNIGDIVAENPDEGFDTINSSVSRTLPDNVEKLILAGSASINGTGNTSGDYVVGNSGSNALNGKSGDDLLNAGAGNDSLVGD